MRSAETVLTIIRDRGKRGLPLEDVYRMLYNPDLYLRLRSLVQEQGSYDKRGHRRNRGRHVTGKD